MRLSDDGVRLITEYETFQAKAYDDGTGVITIGYGTTRIDGQPVHPGMVCTRDQARAWFKEEVTGIEPVVESSCPGGLTQSQFDALVSFTYNVGIAGFKSSTIARKLAANQVAYVMESNFLVWNKAKSKHTGELIALEGLTRRRESEWILFSTGVVNIFK